MVKQATLPRSTVPLGCSERAGKAPVSLLVVEEGILEARLEALHQIALLVPFPLPRPKAVSPRMRKERSDRALQRVSSSLEWMSYYSEETFHL